MNKRNRKQGFTLLELMMVICIISILVSIAIPAYEDARRRARISAAIGEIGANFRSPLSAYYALHGTWPKDWAELEEIMPPTMRRKDTAGVSEYRLENGAITAVLKAWRGQAGEVLTVHPAVPAGDPLGPVKFVAGPKSDTAGWLVIGEDHTTIDQDHIIRVSRK